MNYNIILIKYKNQNMFFFPICMKCEHYHFKRFFFFLLHCRTVLGPQTLLPSSSGVLLSGEWFPFSPSILEEELANKS